MAQPGGSEINVFPLGPVNFDDQPLPQLTPRAEAVFAENLKSDHSRSDEGGLKSLSVPGERTESVFLQSDNRK